MVNSVLGLRCCPALVLTTLISAGARPADAADIVNVGIANTASDVGGEVSVERVLDMSFAAAAVAELGPYKPRTR